MFNHFFRYKVNLHLCVNHNQMVALCRPVYKKVVDQTALHYVPVFKRAEYFPTHFYRISSKRLKSHQPG